MASVDEVDDVMVAAVEGFLNEWNIPVQELNLSGDNDLVVTCPQLETDADSWKRPTNFQLKHYPLTTDTGESDECKGESAATKTTKANQRTMNHRRETSLAMAAKRRTRYQQRVRREKEFLTLQANELSIQLSKLRAAQKENEEVQMESFALCAWKAIAALQKEKRLVAEEQQARLRAAMLRQSRLIHQIDVFARVCDQEKACGEETADDVLLGTFVRELNSLYAQTNDIFQSVGLLDVSTPMTYGPTWKCCPGIQYVENADVIVIPYNFDQVSRALSLLLLVDMDGCNYMASTEDPDNTSAGKYNITYSSKLGTSTTITTFLAIRRYQEADRLVFVWRALFEGQGEFENHHSDETGWFMARPSSEMPSSSSSLRSTISTGYSRLVSIRTGNISDGNLGTEQFAKAVMKAQEKEYEEMMEMLEKMLINTTHR